MTKKTAAPKLTPAEIEAQEITSLAQLAKWERKRAIDAANNYFDEVLAEVERMKQDVEQYRDRFADALEADSLHNTKPTDVLNWTANRVQQFNAKSDLAVRAAVEIAKHVEK